MMRSTIAGLCALVLAVIPLTVFAQPGTSPQTLTRYVVERLNGTGRHAWATQMGQSGGEPTAPYVDPAFLSLLTENDRLARRTGIGVDYDSDPVCQCQDNEGANYHSMGITQVSPDVANVQIGYGSPVLTYTLVLRRIAGTWRVSDVVTGEEGSVRAVLARHNACMRNSHGEAAIGRCIGD